MAAKKPTNKKKKGSPPSPRQAVRNKIDLFKLYKSIQENIVERLTVNSQVFSHPVVKGDATELDWFKVLTEFLPARYEVSNGVFIIDHNGDASDWIDLVIHDRFYLPLFFTVGKTKCIPAESVHAVFEVKPDFNATTIGYATDKAASVRGLKRTSVGYPTTVGQVVKQKPKKIIAGLLATSSDYHPATSAIVVSKLRALTTQEQLDFVCVLNEVAFTVKYGSRFSVATSKPDAVLMFFLVRLLEMMVARGPTTQLDLKAYGSVLNGNIIK